jgi:predicted enzyme related to lactoylglutathione lyase
LTSHAPARACPLVHLELRTRDAARACAFASELFGWSVETLRVARGSYIALTWGTAIEGGVVEELGGEPALWLPYVEVSDVVRATERATELGASVLLSPREGPAGWRSRILHPACGDLALWQPKR